MPNSHETMPLRVALISVGFLMFCSVDSASGQGLLGRKYFEIRGGVVAPQDDVVQEIDDIGPLIGAAVNHPLTEHFDLNLGVEYSRLSGDFGNAEYTINAIGFAGGANYHFRPDERIDPFVGLSAGFVEFDSEFQSPHFKQSDRRFEPSLAMGGGLEIDLTDKVAIRPQLLYSQIDDVDEFSVGAGVNYWWTEEIFGGFIADYATEVRDVSLRIRLGFAY